MKNISTTVFTLLLSASSLILFSFISSEGGDSATAQKATEQENSTAKRVYTNKEDNQLCLKCHGKTHIEFRAEGSEDVYKQKMFAECIIDTALYYSGNHWNFKCTDCHTDEYGTFPHKGELRFEEIPGCLDCHGGDPKYETFQFEKIDEAYQKSIHYQRQSSSFSCWSCHDGNFTK